MITLCAAGIVLGSATAAAGYFSLTDTGTGGSRAGAVGGPTDFTATSSFPDQATLSWIAPANPAPTGYTLTQSPGTVAGTCTTNLTTSSVSCTATGLAPGTPYTWTLRSNDHSWSSPAATAKVTTVTPTISLTPTSGKGGTLVEVTGSGFASSSALRFAFISSTGATTTLTPAGCTPTTTATGALPAGPCEVTVPTPGATGTGSVKVTDGAGNSATAPFDVTGGSGLGTMTVTPPSAVASSTGNTFAFAFTAPNTGTTDGTVTLAVPTGWTPPSTSSAAVGYVTLTPAAAGTATVTGDTITVTGVTLAPGSSFAIVYGTGGGAHGVTVTSALGPSTFLAEEASTSSGTPATIAAQPTVDVTATCAPITETQTLAEGVTTHFFLRGASGGNGGNTGGAGAGGTVVSGTLTNTSGATVTLTYTLGCNGSLGATQSGGAGGPGYADGGTGGTGYSTGTGGGGGGGGASVLTVTVGNTTTVVAVAGGGGGGAGENTGGGAGGGPASPTTVTAPTTTPAAGGNGTSPSSDSTNGGAGGGGGGGGVHLAATGGGAGSGGTGGTSYVRGAGTFTGVAFGSASIVTGTSGSTATVRFT